MKLGSRKEREEEDNSRRVLLSKSSKAGKKAREALYGDDDGWKV